MLLFDTYYECEFQTFIGSRHIHKEIKLQKPSYERDGVEYTT